MSKSSKNQNIYLILLFEFRQKIKVFTKGENRKSDPWCLCAIVAKRKENSQ
jgi:hypothetical protein